MIFPQKGIFGRAGIFQLSCGRGRGGATVFMEYKLGFVYYGVPSDGEKYRKAFYESVFENQSLPKNCLASVVLLYIIFEPQI